MGEGSRDNAATLRASKSITSTPPQLLPSGEGRRDARVLLLSQTIAQKQTVARCCDQALATGVLLGMSIAQGGMDHLHFRLVRGGMTPGQAVALFWSFAAAFGGAGLFIRGREKLLALVILAILFLLITFIIGKRAHGSSAGRS